MRWMILIAILALAAGVGAEPGPQTIYARDSIAPGRTDGPEGSEYGKGGYWHNAQYGRFYTEGFWGAAQVDIGGVGLDGVGSSQTDLVSGLNVGYAMEDWLAFQLGFAQISDQKIRLYSGGVRSAYTTEPFNYFLSLDAELYSPDRGESRFGIVPGAGVEVILHRHLRVGLRFQHDFIFADETIGINRFTAKVQLDF